MNSQTPSCSYCHRPTRSAGSFGECWTLDETGNWKGYRRDHTGDGAWDVVQSRTSNAVNEIVATTGTPAPAYDAAGNMTTLGSGGGTGWAELTLGDWSDLELSEWAAMPLTSGGTAGLTATYDAWNRLVKLSRGTETVRTYRYDGRKYRIAVGVYSGGSLSTTRHLYYSTDWRVLEERVVLSGSGTAAETTAPAERQFLWGTRYIDDLIFRDRDADGNSTLDERKYALQDANWNVIALTNTGGTVEERYAYSAYSAYGAPAFLGASFKPTGSGTSPCDWETLYAGYRHEPATGLFHVRNRAYSPGLGVWLQRDPVADPHAPSLYAYGDAQPLVMTDVFGLQAAMSPAMMQELGSSIRNTHFDSGEYAQGVGDVFRGYGDAAVGTATGVWHLATTNPFVTAGALGDAAWNYDRTFEQMCDNFDNKLQSNRGCGELVGDFLIGIGTGGALKSASQSGKIAKILQSVDKRLPDCLSPWPHAPRRNPDFIRELARRAERKKTALPGETPRHLGTRKHTYAEDLLNRYQRKWWDRDLHPEVRYKDGIEIFGRTPKGSVRLDVIEGSRVAPRAVYDYKFGREGLSPNRISQVRREAGLSPDIPVIEVRP